MRRLDLSYHAPLDWDALRHYLARRAMSGVEAVIEDDGGRYTRSVTLDGHRGYFTVGRRAGVLRVELSDELIPARASLEARLRRMFDLDADVASIDALLARDSFLAPQVARRPGLRVPGTVDGFGLALRAILGQQVTVRGASTLAGRLVRLIAEPLRNAPAPLAYYPVSAERLAQASLSSVAAIGMPRARAQCILALARAVANGELPELTEDVATNHPEEFGRRFAALPGIGSWTVSYVLMRGLHWADAFPEGDIGLRRAMGGLTSARLRSVAEAWRPWRAYAAQHLWASLPERTNNSLERPSR